MKDEYLAGLKNVMSDVENLKKSMGQIGVQLNDEDLSALTRSSLGPTYQLLQGKKPLMLELEEKLREMIIKREGGKVVNEEENMAALGKYAELWQEAGELKGILTNALNLAKGQKRRRTIQ